MPFTSITIIYNPRSTGPSRRLAEDCQQTLKSKLPTTPVKLRATEYAGHAEELAYGLACADGRPLIISSSGDGGYHEVVNGVLRANRAGRQAVTALLPGGNANDHHRRLHNEDFEANILSGVTRQIDVLCLTGVVSGADFERYAHSYIGLGLTPWIGRQLTKAELNRCNETLITLRSLLSVRGTRLIVDGEPQTYRSLVFTNIGRMAKYLNIAAEAKVDDGKFEVSMVPRRSRLHMFASLLKASTVGLPSSEQTDSFQFETTRRTLVQLDGEVLRLDAHSQAEIAIIPYALECIV